jgi:hypothetical protein
VTLDPARLDSLEQTIGRLAQELAEARRALAALRSESPPVAAVPLVVPPASQAEGPPEPGTARRASRAGDGLENMIGRYGALALAVLTIVMGAGALVSWAISHGLLGPWVRVTLGALLALAIAGGGSRLRVRGARRFGNVLFALSLAVIQVVGWGAGPRLGLIRPSVALGIADAASISLAFLALVEKEQLLYAVGLGGALIAPFVMASGEPHFGMLAAYGLLVLATAIRTIGDRPWWNAVGIVLAGTAVYTVGVNGYHSGVPWIDREFAASFAGVVGVMALVWERKPARPWIALGAVTTMALAACRAGPHAVTRLDALFAAPDVQFFAFMGTALFFATVRDLDERQLSPLWTLAVIVVPAVFLTAALSALGPVAGPVSGSVVLAWGLVYCVFSLREHGNRRGVLIAAGGFVGLWAISLLFDGAPDALPVVVAVYAVLLAAVAKQEKQPVVLLATGMSLVVAFAVAATHLAVRTGYGYTMTPFLSVASLGVASAVGATFLSARYGLADRVSLFNEEFARGRVGALAASVPAFVWGHLEFRHAFSADISTFLLIAYYASCGVFAIHRGRVLGEGRLRQVGLSLAALAALYAIVAASSVQEIGLRVGSYLLVGIFLLGVAWWYRGEGRVVAENSIPPSAGPP